MGLKNPEVISLGSGGRTRTTTLKLLLSLSLVVADDLTDSEIDKVEGCFAS